MPLHDLGARRRCQGQAEASAPFAPRLAATALAVAAALTSGACTYSPQTTVKVKDASAVRMDVKYEGKDATILAPTAAPDQRVMPLTEPPYIDTMMPVTIVKRQAGGAMTIECASCDEDWRHQELLTQDGTMKFGVGASDFHVAHLDFTGAEMRLRFNDVRTERSLGATITASVASPWDNVTLIQKVDTPNRSLGVKLLLAGGVSGLLGGLGVADGLTSDRKASLYFGLPIAGIAAMLLGVGSWYAFAPVHEHVLYKGGDAAPQAPPAQP
jgi:hypothetical protein